MVESAHDTVKDLIYLHIHMSPMEQGFSVPGTDKPETASQQQVRRVEGVKGTSVEVSPNVEEMEGIKVGESWVEKAYNDVASVEGFIEDGKDSKVVFRLDDGSVLALYISEFKDEYKATNGVPQPHLNLRLNNFPRIRLEDIGMTEYAGYRVGDELMVKPGVSDLTSENSTLLASVRNSKSLKILAFTKHPDSLGSFDDPVAVVETDSGFCDLLKAGELNEYFEKTSA